jgi:hypothetical protein
MGIAFEMALASLGATRGCDDPIRAALAQRIVALAQAGGAIPSGSVMAPCGRSVLLLHPEGAVAGQSHIRLAG